MEIVWFNEEIKNNVDQTAQYLQEADPVFLCSIKQGGSGSNTSKSKNATASQLNLKQGVRKTGVEFQWYQEMITQPSQRNREMSLALG